MFIVLLAVSLGAFQLNESTERADWYVLKERPKLKVDVEKCERFLRETERTFGVVVPRFAYFRVQTATEVSIWGGSYAGGVTKSAEGTIVSTEACSTHEIVHLVIGQIGHADPMFEEGTAAMLGKEYDWVKRRTIRSIARRRGERYLTLAHSFERPVASVEELRFEYVLADAWVRYLVKRHGMPKLVEFFRVQAAGRAAGKDTYDSFRQVYGDTLTMSFIRWLYGKKGLQPAKARHR